MQLKTKTIEYNFEKKLTINEDSLAYKRIATIIFKEKPMTVDFATRTTYKVYWQFKECKYSGLSEIYTEEDWDFLKEVADEIKNIKKELNK